MRDPSSGTLLDSFKEVASSMPIPDEFEYTLENQEIESFKYLEEDSKML